MKRSLRLHAGGHGLPGTHSVHRQPTTKRSQGFILVVTLWVLAGLALLAAYIDSVASANLEQAYRMKRALDAELDRLSTEATVLYLLASNRMGYRGLVLAEQQVFTRPYDDNVDDLPTTADGELRFDDTAYQGIGGWRFSLQDEFGLVSVNRPEAASFAALLEWAGVGVAQRARIVASTLDYIDLDHQLTLNGAERFSYLQQGRQPPPNWNLTSPAEIKKVLGFAEAVSAEQWRKLKPLLSIRPPGGYNFNTMPAELLPALLGSHPRSVEALLQARAAGPVWSGRQVAALTGVSLHLEEELIARLPSEFVRLSMWRPERGGRLLIGLQLTPFVADAPWRKDYQYWEQTSEQDASTPEKAATALL